MRRVTAHGWRTSNMHPEARKAIALSLHLKVRELAERNGKDVPRRIRVSESVAHDVECHRARPNTVWIGAASLTHRVMTTPTHQIKAMLDDVAAMALKDYDELRHPETHTCQHDSIAEFERQLSDSLNMAPHSDLPSNGKPSYTCLLCDREGTHRVLGLSKRFEACATCAGQVKGALGRQVKVIRMFTF